MTLLASWQAALLGLGEIGFGAGDGGRFFRDDAAGFAVALGAYGVVVVLSMLVQGVAYGVPGPGQVATGILLNVAALAGLCGALAIGRIWLKLAVSPWALLVPAVYGLAVMLLAGVLLILISGDFGVLLLGVFGYLLYRIGRRRGVLTAGQAAGFAVCCVVALVALPVALYMLVPNPAPAA